MKQFFTSEQVSCGHPDKICDQIADAILDECLRQDKSSRVAVEVMIKNYDVIISGEVTTKAELNLYEILDRVLTYVGVDNKDKYVITNLLDKQSQDIAMGVDTGGAGDQGIMFGYACNETKELMPLAWSIANKALINLKELNSPLLKADSKSQVTIEYENNIPKRIDTFLISTQHDEEAINEEIKETVKSIMIKTAKEYNMNTDFKVLVNPTGRFVIGGSHGDAGVTGRKIIADTYGGYAHHGGGAFSGKDPSKVDRSAAYMARKMAKEIVAKNMADKCEIQLSYAIGVKEPISIFINCFDTNKVDINVIEKNIKEKYDLSPKGIIEYLDLLNTEYSKTTVYGHFGKEHLPWEKI
ncbi:MAG: methionine adenosyltransferase [Clostridia bacterium]|nr:methionine adenosyltransferase [Clostridia bacterium]MDD4375934.1 methionine adenosyltransferase [Clostridia bacterium]